MSAQEKKRLINAVKIWCTHCGFEEIENRSYTADIVFKNGEESVPRRKKSPLSGESFATAIRSVWAVCIRC